MDEGTPREKVDWTREREERMRYEILRMLCDAAEADPANEVYCRRFAQDLGVWYAEVFRVIDWLTEAGYVEYCGAGPVVRITPAGIHHVATHPLRTGRLPG